MKKNEEEKYEESQVIVAVPPGEPATDFERQESLFEDQDYYENEVLELDDLALALEQEANKDGGDSVIPDLLKRPGLKRVDFFNILFPFKLMESALTSTLLELRLSSCKIMTQECLQIAGSPIAQNLRSLDLSCNPIKLQGLLNLLDPRLSQLRFLRKLELFYCNIIGAV
jgi:hypothetical protein